MLMVMDVGACAIEGMVAHAVKLVNGGKKSGAKWSEE